MLRLNLLFAYINQSAGIGAHMGADSGAYLDDPLLRGLNADRFQPLCQGLGYGALVGVHDVEGEVRIRSLGGGILAQGIHALAHAHGLGGDADGTVALHGDDGLDIGQGAQLVHRVGDPSALVQVFQGVDAGKQPDPAADILNTGDDLFGGFVIQKTAKVRCPGCGWEIDLGK